MNDIHITLTGNVAAEPRQHTFNDGSRVTSLRVASRHRYFDRKTKEWADGDTVYFAVRCWRGLGDNVVQSVQIGHPVVIAGKLRIREFGPEGDRRFMPEVEATSIGHDLRWGIGAFTKPERGGNTATLSRETRESLDESTQDWAMSSSSQSANVPALAALTTGGAPFSAGAEFDRAGDLATAPGGTADALGSAVPGSAVQESAASGSGERRATSGTEASEGTSSSHSDDASPSRARGVSALHGVGGSALRAGDASEGRGAGSEGSAGGAEGAEAAGSASGGAEALGSAGGTGGAGEVEASGSAGSADSRVKAAGGAGRARRSKAGATARVLGADDTEDASGEIPWPAGAKAAA